MVTAEEVLRELLRLYDWRLALAEIERDVDHNRKEMKRCLQKYGREKKAAWEQARKVINGGTD